MSKIIGFIDLHDEPSLERLTEKRPLAAVSFLGRYAMIDFILSNYSNSGIDQVQILLPAHYDSLRSHLQNGSVWIRNTKTGYIRPVLNEKGLSNPNQNTDISNIVNNIPRSALEADYFIVAPSHFLSSMDFNPIVKAHINSGRQITVVTTKIKKSDAVFTGCDELDVNKDNVITKSRPYVNNSDAYISLNTYIFNNESFFEMISFARGLSSNYSIRKIINHFINNHIIPINNYEFDGYVVPITSLQTYIKFSFDLLTYSKRQKLFKSDWPIYTTTHNTPPAIYGKNAEVINSFITNGAIVKGKVKNSIICRDVTIEEGAEVSYSIILSHSHIGKGVKVSHVITDKEVTISSIDEVVGEVDCPLFLTKGMKV